MTEKALYDTWENRWKNSKDKEDLTLLGRWMFKAKQKIIFEAIKALEVKTVIEVGCGLGYTMQVFHKAGLSYIGIDVSRRAVEACQKKGLSAELKNLEDVNEQYDLVSCDGMLEHFLNFKPYAEHLMRISRRYVLLIQPNHESFLGKTFVYLSELFCGNKNVFEYNYRIDDFITFFEKNNFFINKNLPIFFDVFRILIFENLSHKNL